MKKLTALFLVLSLSLALAACGAAGGEASPTPAAEPSAEPSAPSASPSGGEEGTDGGTLVVYFSASGNTERVAGYIAEATGADVFVIEPAEPYTSDDLNWTDESSRVVYEHDNPDAQDVELVSSSVDGWETYDTVFIGYPIWWGVAAWPVSSFVADNDFTGKTVVPFCTSSSSGLGQSGTLLAGAELGSGNWLEGRRFSSGAGQEDVDEWIASLGL